MLVECNHCGAPLDVSGREAVVACAYCDRRHRLPRMRTIAPDTPSDWRPPEVWTPPAEVKARRRPLRLHPVKILLGVVWTVRRLVSFAIFAAVALGGAVFLLELSGAPGDESTALSQLTGQLGDDATREKARQKIGALRDKLLDDEKVGQLVEAATERLGSTALGAMMWDGAEPYECKGNARVRLEGVHANLPGRTAIAARDNCQLHIVECTVEAWNAVEVANNARVVIERSKLTAKGEGASVEGNGHLELVETSVVAGTVGVSVRANGRVVLGSGRVEGATGAVSLAGNARGELRELELKGKVQARKGRLAGYPR